MTSNFRVVVGVDGSEGGRKALTWAIHEASRRGGTVQAVIAWRWDSPDLPPHATTHPDQQRDQADQVLSEEIGALPVFNRDSVTIATEAVEGRAGDVLVEAARDADLLVLGSHGHSRVHHTVLGSVSEDCIRKATCPVVVLPIGEVAPRPGAEPAIRA